MKLFPSLQLSTMSEKGRKIPVRHWIRSNLWSVLSILFTVVTVIFMAQVYLKYYHEYEELLDLLQSKRHIIIKESEFENFDNETGGGEIIVPNIVHFLRFDLPLIKFTDAVCILAALKNHKPDKIYLHTNVNNFTGKYWDYLLNITEFQNVYEIKTITLPPKIFGQAFSKSWHTPHASDVTRVRILMQYGGIFLDNDSFLVQNLTKYRYFEMALGWDDNKFLGTQVLVAHPNARFLKLWLECYRDNYHPEWWYYNAGERPTQTVLFIKPELIHRVKLKFGVHMLVPNLYKSYWTDWRAQEAIHLLMNHRYYLDKEHLDQFPEFTDENIFNCNVTFCVMARDVYFQRL